MPLFLSLTSCSLIDECLSSGAGIGGLTLAVALMRFPDIEVEIFEGASRLAEVGAGIGLFPRAFFLPYDALKFLH